MHLKSIPILPEQLGVPGGDQRLNLRGPADREGRRGREIWSGFAWLSQDGKSRPLSNGIQPKNGRETPGCSRAANPDHPGRPIPIVLVAKCQAVAAWQISTTFRRHLAEKRSQNARLPQHGRSQPSWEAQREETQQKKGAAGGDPCRCDELFAWHAVTPPQAPPRRAPQRAPRPQRARCRDTPSLPGWTRRTWPHR